MPQQTEAQRQAAFQAAGLNQAQQQQVIAGQPAAQSPVAPTPQMQTPPAPQPTSPVTVNVGTATPSQTQVPQQTQQTRQAQSQTGALTYDPAVNPSIIDLLNQTGADSSKQGRTALAGQLGVQNYDFSAAKNMELAKKYTEMYNAKKGTAAPQSQAEAMQQAITYADENQPQQSIEDTQKAMMDSYLSMNPIMKTMYDSINHILSAPATTQTFQEEYAKLFQEQGIPALQTEYMNIKNIMDGTEDDIRNEITKAGGFATESQVQAMSGARNKVLLKQANVLQQQLALKQDYVDQLMRFSQLDREQVDKEVERKLGLTEKMAKIQDQITTAARDNYQKVIDKVGFKGLAGALAGDTQAQSNAETILGLPKGSLSNPSALKFLTPEPEKKLQYVSATERQSAGVFDPSTGTFTPLGGGGGGGGSGYPNLPVSVRESADTLRDAADNLASSFGTKFQKDAFMTQVDGLLNKGDIKSAAELIFSRSIQQIPDSEQRKKVTGRYEMVKRLDQINSLLDDYYAKGGTTGYFKGTSEQIAQRFGQSGDPELAKIGTTIMNAIDELVRFRTGAALTEAEQAYYDKLLPGIWKSAQLNEANISGLRDSLSFDVEAALQAQLTVAGYAAVEKALAESVMGMTPVATTPSSSGEATVQVRDKSGTVGTIPISELTQALKEGYSLNNTMTLSGFPGLTPYKAK